MRIGIRMRIDTIGVGGSVRDSTSRIRWRRDGRRDNGRSGGSSGTNGRKGSWREGGKHEEREREGDKKGRRRGRREMDEEWKDEVELTTKRGQESYQLILFVFFFSRLKVRDRSPESLGTNSRYATRFGGRWLGAEGGRSVVSVPSSIPLQHFKLSLSSLSRSR